MSGDAINPTYVNTTTSFYHAALGAGTQRHQHLLFPVYPDLAYDSWVTIGLEGAPNALAGEANVSTVQATDNPWMTNFDPGGGLPGDNIAIDDLIGGAWYALNGDANGIAGDDLKVLIGQFTTTGEIGQIYCQVFINGNGQTELDTFFGPDADVEGAWTPRPATSTWTRPPTTAPARMPRTASIGRKLPRRRRWRRNLRRRRNRRLPGRYRLQLRRRRHRR